MYLRNPYERVASMWTGTSHVAQTNTRTIDEFVLGWLTNHTPFMNEHFMGQLEQCSFGLPATHPLAPRWDAIVLSGENGENDEFRRVTTFVKHVFGEDTYKRVGASGWCAKCNSMSQAGGRMCTPENDAFFAPHGGKGKVTVNVMSAEVRAEIARLYPDDVQTYEWYRKRQVQGLNYY